MREHELRLENIGVELDLDEQLAETIADAAQVQQALLNLILNAEQAILQAKDSGHIWIRTRSISAGPHSAGSRRRWAGRLSGNGAADLRSVLHYKAGRRGDRAWTFDSLRDRASTWRRGFGGKPAGRRRGIHGGTAQRHAPSVSDARPYLIGAVDVGRCGAQDKSARQSNSGGGGRADNSAVDRGCPKRRRALRGYRIG